MDWTPTEVQTAVADLAKQVLRTSASPWADLADAGLFELDTMVDIAALLEQVGRTGGTVPALETLVLGAPARLEDDPADIVLTGAPFSLGLRVRDGRAHGVVDSVASGTTAARMVFPADDGLYAVSLADCSVEAQVGTNEDDVARVVLDGSSATALGGLEAVADWHRRCGVGIAAMLLGLSRQALIMTAKYTSTRHQFGRPIASFQAVSQRAADAWIQVNAMELTLAQAAWRLDEGLPCGREVVIARYLAAEGSHRVLAAAQHLHGGMGFDKDYALHRYFLTAKAWEFVGGGAAEQLERLGEIVAL